MDFYEAVVADYLRADRSLFINTQCCIQINESPNPDLSGPHWYCDAVAVDFRSEVIFLCEISYGARLADLIKRLRAWADHWPAILKALSRDSHLPPWPTRPWLFVPEDRISLLIDSFSRPDFPTPLPYLPRITPLEMAQPWRYSAWNRDGEGEKPDGIPAEMVS